LSEKNKGKSTIWMYAVILFTSAFIVLLLTAYSQIKFNKNIDEYKSQLSNEKTNYEINLKSTLEENKKFKDQLESLNTELASSKGNEQTNKKNIDDINEKYKQISDSYEALYEAENNYSQGDFIRCAEILYKNVNYNIIGTAGKKNYKYLTQKTFDKAAYKLFLDGYADYKAKSYKTAITKFRLSNNLIPNEYYSDDCIYLLGHAEVMQGDKVAAKKAFTELLSRYPKTTFKNEISDLLNDLN
jgi:TolA-binding protein